MVKLEDSYYNRTMRQIIISLKSSWRSSASMRLLWSLALVLVLLITTVIYASYASNQPLAQTFAQIDFLTKPTETTTKQSITTEKQESSQDTNKSSGIQKSSMPSTQNQSSGSTTSSNSSNLTQSSTDNDTQESQSARVAFYGDSQSDTDAEDTNHAITLASILKNGANPVFHLGDLMEDGTQASLDRFNSVAADLLASRTFYGALGNNDRKIGDSGTPSPLYLTNFSFPGNERWYSLNIGNLHVVVLDSAFSSTAPGSAQYNWLSGDLQNQDSQSRITAVIFHHPPYGLGGDSKGLVSTIVPLFRNYGVDFVISGHEHTYQKTTVDGVEYFISSGQPSIGYIVASVYASYANVLYYNEAGNLIDTTRVNAR